MLDHLMSLYRLYKDRPARLTIEARQWLSQYSVAADDFAFSIGLALHAYAMAQAECSDQRGRRVASIWPSGA